VKCEGRMLLQNRGIILELILELSRMGCELDSSDSVHRLSEGTAVPARAMLSVSDTEIATQKVLPEFDKYSCQLIQRVLY
jgi:hypothetical protein